MSINFVKYFLKNKSLPKFPSAGPVKYGKKLGTLRTVRIFGSEQLGSERLGVECSWHLAGWRRDWGLGSGQQRSAAAKRS
jgi:hypothetical protein